MSKAPSVETIGMTMKFGGFTALDDVSIKIKPGSFHALLGENGAGKSTLVKCMMGFYQATSGSLLVDDREVLVPDPNAAHALGLGMVYQHFTLVPSLTAAENLVISRHEKSQIINWQAEHEALGDFMGKMPFSVPLDQPIMNLSAGECQKLEILKQLYLGRTFCILDEPTSVLTPQEADEVLTHVRNLCEAGEITVLMITHKFREVSTFADSVSVLRRGQYAGGGEVSKFSTQALASMMVGEDINHTSGPRQRSKTGDKTVLDIKGLKAADKSGRKPIEIDALEVAGGEIVGIAGISGNGQMELMQVLTGQREQSAGEICVKGKPYQAKRRIIRDLNIRALPEEPLKNASVARMSVTENLAFRDYDNDSDGRSRFWLNNSKAHENARTLIDAFKVKTSSPDAPIETLSGGNVQRAVLARELTGKVDLLLISNPCFGLDFSAVAEIRARILSAREQGVAILLMSEDLDEIIELSDRILVMSEGKITFQTTAEKASVAEIGSHMAGHA